MVKKQSGELEPGDLHFLFPLRRSCPLRSTSPRTTRMVLLVTTDRILNALEAVPGSRRQELDLPATLELHGPIAHEQILRLSKHLQHDAEYNATQDTGRSPTILSALLRGTKVYVPPPPKKPEPVRVVNPRRPRTATDQTPEPRIPCIQSPPPRRRRKSSLQTPPEPKLHPQPERRRPTHRDQRCSHC